MSSLGRLLLPISRVRRTARFRLWVWRTRFTLARQGFAFDVHAPEGASFDGPPAVRLSLQFRDRGQGGSLRIELGRWVHLGRDLEIEVRPSTHNVMALGDGVVCQAGLRFALFGGEIRVGAWSHLRDGAMLKSSGRLLLGERIMVARFSSVQADREVVLEDHVGLGERVTILDSDHVADGSDTCFLDHPIVTEPVHVSRNTWISANAVLMRGVRIGRNALVAAGSIVRGGEYPDGWLIAGSPAKPRRALSDASVEAAADEAG